MTDLDRLLAAGDALADASADVRDDLEAEVMNRYKGTLHYPSQKARYDRDMAAVLPLTNGIDAWRALAREVKEKGIDAWRALAREVKEKGDDA